MSTNNRELRQWVLGTQLTAGVALLLASYLTSGATGLESVQTLSANPSQPAVVSQVETEKCS